MIDGEGCVSNPEKLRTPGGHKMPRRVSICNTDATIIEAAEHVLKTFGIDYFKQTVRHQNPKWSTTYNLVVQKRVALERLAEVVSLACARKQQFLLGHMAHYKGKDAAEAERRDLIPKLYLLDKLSVKEIAARLKMGVVQVARELHKQGVSTSGSDAMVKYFDRVKGRVHVPDDVIVAAYKPPEVSIRDVVTLLGTSREYVMRVLARNGVSVVPFTRSQGMIKAWKTRRRNQLKKQPCLPLSN